MRMTVLASPDDSSELHADDVSTSLFASSATARDDSHGHDVVSLFAYLVAGTHLAFGFAVPDSSCDPTCHDQSGVDEASKVQSPADELVVLEELDGFLTPGHSEATLPLASRFALGFALTQSSNACVEPHGTSCDDVSRDHEDVLS